MTIRKKELLVLSMLACVMAAWTVGAAIGFFSQVTRVHLQNHGVLLTPTALVVVACASLVILFVIAYFIRAILRETPPTDDP